MNLSAKAPKHGDVDLEVDVLTLSADTPADRAALAELASILFDAKGMIRERVQLIVDRHIAAEAVSDG